MGLFNIFFKPPRKDELQTPRGQKGIRVAIAVLVILIVIIMMGYLMS